jgi:hypothetical protein
MVVLEFGAPLCCAVTCGAGGRATSVTGEEAHAARTRKPMQDVDLTG